MDSGVTIFDNLFAGVVGGLVIFLVSFLWFNGKTFFPIWWRLIGKEGDPAIGNHSMGVIFGSTFMATLVQGVSLAWILSLIESSLSVAQGFGYGLILGVAFAAATSLGHRLFGQQGFRVWAIEVGADVLGLALAGAVISFWI